MLLQWKLVAKMMTFVFTCAVYVSLSLSYANVNLTGQDAGGNDGDVSDQGDAAARPDWDRDDEHAAEAQGMSDDDGATLF